jgi:hypothetical protein
MPQRGQAAPWLALQCPPHGRRSHGLRPLPEPKALLLRLLKDALLLRAPRPPPGGPILARRLPRLEGWVTGPPQVAGFVSTCTVLVASVGVWCVRALVLGPARA